MNCLKRKTAAALLVSAGLLALASCSSEKKTEPDSSAPTQGTRMVTVAEGEAGGTVEDTFTASARVSDIQKSSRKITLIASDGTTGTFTAGPQIRNFDQLRVGDKVTATISERLVVFVRSDGADPSITHAAALSAAPKGAKPGAIVAEMYEIVATVKSIDPAKRTATLQFGADQAVVQVRQDVDLSRYKVGDSVVIRVTAMLSVLAESP